MRTLNETATIVANCCAEIEAKLKPKLWYEKYKGLTKDEIKEKKKEQRRMDDEALNELRMYHQAERLKIAKLNEAILLGNEKLISDICNVHQINETHIRLIMKADDTEETT